MDRNKLKLTFLLLIAVVPISLATWVFDISEFRGVSATTNNGVLVVPVLDVVALDLRDAAGAPTYLPFDDLVKDVTPEDYEPRPWQLLYLGATHCDAACEERLYFLRQLHTRLGRESDRVERVYVQVSDTAQQMPDATAQMLAQQQADMKVSFTTSSVLQRQLAPTVPAGADPVGEHYIYVVDPVGNVMMYFTPGNTTEEIFKDLDKLLDRSSLG